MGQFQHVFYGWVQPLRRLLNNKRSDFERDTIKVGLADHIRLCRWTGVIAVSAAYIATAHAANVRFVPGNNNSVLVIEGTIQDGDCDSLLSLIRTSHPKAVYLASPGGSLLEALRIGRLVRALKLATIVPVERVPALREQPAAIFGVKIPNENLMCASACFFVFVAGVDRNQDLRIGTPVLGIHRAFLSDGDLNRLSSNRTIEAATHARKIVESYLREMGVRSVYVDHMFSTPKDQMYWITGAQFRSDFEGLLPELKDWIAVRARDVLDRVSRTDTSNFSADDLKVHEFLSQVLSDPTQRQAFVLDDLRFDAWQKLIGRPGTPGIFDAPSNAIESVQPSCKS